MTQSELWSTLLQSKNSFNFLQLHRSHDKEMKMSSLLVTSEDDKVMQSCFKESQGCIDIDLYAPDTLDLQGTYIFVTLCLSGTKYSSLLTYNICVLLFIH